jgi:hypothetical protein
MIHRIFRLAGLVEDSQGVFVRLPSEFMSGQVVSLSMGDGGSRMGMRG